MAAYFAQGRLGTEISNLSLHGLWMIVEHSPHNDHWMKGGSLHAIIARIAKLEGSKVCDVDAEVKKMRDKKAIDYSTQMENMSNNEWGMNEWGVLGSMVIQQLESGEW